MSGPSTAQRAPEALQERSPEQLLGELRDSLERAYRRPPARSRQWQAVALAAVIVAAAAVALVALLPGRRTAGTLAPARLPRTAGSVAAGVTGGVHWALALAPCSRGVALAIVTAAGSVSAACGRLLAPPASFYDQADNVTLVFGAAPAGTRTVQLASPAGMRAAATRPLGSRGVLYVGAIGLNQIVTASTAYGRDAHLLSACTQTRCVTP